MSNEVDSLDVIIIGGGVAGLTTAALLARAGKSVTLFEQSSSEIGGRARTSIYDGFYFNQGPHALFLAAAGAVVLQELGIAYTGGIPPPTGLRIRHEVKYRLLANSSSASIPPGSQYISGEAFDQFFDLVNKIDFTELENVSVQEWIDSNIHDADAIAMMKALIRLVTYANDPGIQSAGSALHQIHLYKLGGVMYLDGGWQTLVDGLLTVATNAKARIVRGKKATKVQRSNSGWLVTLSDHTQISAKILVIATGPKDAHALFHDGERPEVLSKAVKEAKPVRLACLDVALSSLPQKDVLFALGIDSPLYFSVHSASARLAPENGALIHVAKYLGASMESKPKEDEQELEELLDLLQPGWRHVVVKKRPLPNMVVSNALVTAANSGLSGRADPKIEDNLYIVGDWVGSEGLLSSASFASAKRAAQLIHNELAGDSRGSGKKVSQATANGTTTHNYTGVEQKTRAFLESLQEQGGPPIYTLSPQEARAVLSNLQAAAPVAILPADIENRTIAGGPNGQISIQIIRPLSSNETLPVVVYTHGGGWVLGGFDTHERLVRELANKAKVVIVFVNYTRSPEAKYPVAIEEAYAATKWVAENGKSINVDASRLAIAGDSVGGNMAAAVTLLAKERSGPNIAFQALFYPVTDADFDTQSYNTLQEGYWLTREGMKWFWNNYALDNTTRKEPTASPLQASIDQLRGLPPTLVITEEFDVLRDEGEAYAHKLIQAGVPVTATRYLGTIHDFMMLNAISDTQAVRGAIDQASELLKKALSAQ